MNNCFWISNCDSSLANGETCYDISTRIDQKRSRQWFMDSSEHELIFNKKQSLESLNGTPGAAVVHNSLLPDSSSSQSGCQTSERLFIPKPIRCSNVFNAVNVEQQLFENRSRNDSSISLTMSNEVENPSCLNTGLGKAKVNEVALPGYCLSEFLGNKAINTPFQSSSHNMFPGLTYNTADNTITVGQTSNRRDYNVTLPGQFYLDNNMLPIGQASSRENYNICAVEQYDKESGNFMSFGPNYSRSHENLFAVNPFYKKVNETITSVSPTQNKGETSVAITTQQDATVVSLGGICTKENSSILSMVQNSKRGEQTTISFGGLQDSSNSCDILLNQSSVASGSKDVPGKVSVNGVSVSSSRTDTSNKNKEPKEKKVSSNNFPSNVKSLLSTGILDGVPVKYVSWSREKSLLGRVKGTGYLCSCKDCKLSKVVNAYEFERHAGCKTKHPNNHIYFENGKTIYGVVLELKSTPLEILFDVMQNVTGSPINEKNFIAWKASFQAASRELHRIYATEDVAVVT